MNPPAVNIPASGHAATQARLKMLEGSTRCFTFGLLGLLPVVGLPFALTALWVSGSVRRREKYMWNAARPYRVCGMICGAVGTALWTMLLFLVLGGLISYMHGSN
jgi:hypothetical protein